MKETQISHHPLRYSLGSAKKKKKKKNLYFSKSFLEEAASERAKVMSGEVGRIKKTKAWGEKKKEKRQKREKKALSEAINSSKKN